MQISHTFILSHCLSEAQSLMWRKQAAREKTEDDCAREPQKAAILENACGGQDSLRGNTTYEALSLKVGATFMLIYCHSGLNVALDQQQVL